MTDRVKAEASVQAELLLRLRASGAPIIPLVTPNGITLPGSGDPAMQRAVAILKHRMKAEGMIIPGFSDLVLLWDGGCALPETKRPAWTDAFGQRHAAGSPSDDQREFARRAQKCGIPHRYVRSWDALKEFLQDSGAPI